MRLSRAAFCCVLLAVAMVGTVDAQRAAGSRGDRVDRGGRLLPPGSIPAVESYAPMATSVFEVLAVRATDRVIKLRGKDGQTADVHVQEHVYDVSKLKVGDKVKVDFFQPDESDARVRAAGVWLAE